MARLQQGSPRERGIRGRVAPAAGGTIEHRHAQSIDAAEGAHLCESITESEGGRPTLGRILGERSAHDPSQLGIHTEVHEIGRSLRQDPRNRCGEVFVATSLERRSAGERSVQRRTEGVDVARCSGSLATDDLGRRMGEGGRDHTGLGLEGLVHERDAEVCEQWMPECVDQDVLGLDVAVNDPGPMCTLEGARQSDAVADHRRFVERASSSDLLGEGATGDEVHDEVRGPIVGRARMVDRHDVGVRCHGSCCKTFPFETRSLGVGDRGRVQDLDGDITTERGLTTVVDTGEATFTDELEIFDTVDAQLPPRAPQVAQQVAPQSTRPQPMRRFHLGCGPSRRSAP